MEQCYLWPVRFLAKTNQSLELTQTLKGKAQNRPLLDMNCIVKLKWTYYVSVQLHIFVVGLVLHRAEQCRQNYYHY